ncbi:4'-phosphopantetheinyl transferase superfamily protein [Rugosimonospora acidiphila]|uniref:4'-phosphopantetheinyl transferase superfamily protein n=1 Tax=Rugosimonospora acidiphila TaxID=556531 RepID=A0ABP9S797_9ACTN
MLEELLPPSVSCRETREDREVPLFPAEQVIIANAVEKRRREFVTGRWCARFAMQQLGLPPTPIVPHGPQGEPSWPASIVGSITHCIGYRAAAVARRSDLMTLGIDAEPNEPLPGGVLEAVSLPSERSELARINGLDGVCFDRLLFSIKESIYKAWYPRTHKFLDFTDAAVSIVPHQGTFTARILAPPARIAGTRISGFTGRWLARDGLLLTAIGLPHSLAETGRKPATGMRRSGTSVGS